MIGFWATFRVLRCNIRTPSIPCWKAFGRIHICHIWMFCDISYGWDVITKNLWKMAFFKGGGSFWGKFLACTTTLLLEVFTQRNFLADFVRLTYILKNEKSLFEPPFRGLRSNVHTPSIARWKARGRFSIRRDWSFSLSLMAEML